MRCITSRRRQRIWRNTSGSGSARNSASARSSAGEADLSSAGRNAGSCASRTYANPRGSKRASNGYAHADAVFHRLDL